MLLHALEVQTADTSAFEVIVVDDGSSDGTDEVLGTARDRGLLDLHVLRQEQSGGPAAARNRGWRSARAAAIVFTDDDCEPVAEWLTTLLEAAAGSPGAIVQGKVLPNPDEVTPLGAFTRSLMVTGPSPHYETANILYPRKVLAALDGFDENYGAVKRRWSETSRPTGAGEDTDLGWRARGAGIETIFSPGALVHHAVHQRGPLNSLRDASRATDCVKAYRDHPELREHLANGIFFHPSHPLLAQAALAAALVPATPLAALFALPYAAHLVRRCRWSRTPVYTAPFLAARDAVEIVATLRGAMRHRVAVL
jgi:GT2 family glycosyltransferase